LDALIERYCKKLKLSGLYKGYKDIEFKNKEQFIHDLLRIEIEEREINKVNRAIKSAGFKVPKTLADFTFTSNIDIPDTTNIERTKNLEFLERKENLIFLGSVGTGNYRKFYIIERNERLVMKNHQTVL
jgi:DNA replication protein DnaC